MEINRQLGYSIGFVSERSSDYLSTLLCFVIS